MARTFDITFSGDTASLLQRAQKSASEAGATLQGDTQRGSFSGQGVQGHYEVEGNTIHVTITKKPIIVTDSFIESRLRKFFTGS